MLILSAVLKVEKRNAPTQLASLLALLLSPPLFHWRIWTPPIGGILHLPFLPYLPLPFFPPLLEVGFLKYSLKGATAEIKFEIVLKSDIWWQQFYQFSRLHWPKKCLDSGYRSALKISAWTGRRMWLWPSTYTLSTDYQKTRRSIKQIVGCSCYLFMSDGKIVHCA